jgi:hypothetical protein
MGKQTKTSRKINRDNMITSGFIASTNTNGITYGYTSLSSSETMKLKISEHFKSVSKKETTKKA